MSMAGNTGQSSIACHRHPSTSNSNTHLPSTQHLFNRAGDKITFLPYDASAKPVDSHGLLHANGYSAHIHEACSHFLGFRV